MAGSMQIAALHVEGRDDCFTIIELLTRHGISFMPNDRRVEVKEAVGDRGLLAAIPVAILASANRSVGFVLDIDTSAEKRWAQIAPMLEKLGLSAPTTPPSHGYIARIDSLNARVGFWLMPDNRMDLGKLEHLLRTLVPAGDPIVGHAEVATKRAKEIGGRFAEGDTLKAVLHAWLAWQEEPGRPYGTAIKSHYFRVDSPEALAFVAWFRELYGIQAQPTTGIS